MKIESSVTGRQFRFYDDNGNYTGVMNVQVRGPRAIVDSLQNKGYFYKNFDMIWDYINVTCNTSIWHAHIMPGHFEVAIRLIGDRYTVNLLAVEENANRDQCWIEVKKA